MNTQLIDSLVTTATDIILIVGLLSPLLMQVLRFAKAHTANKRVQLLESYAERVVLAVEQQRNLLPSDKKKLAVKRLADYVNKSKLNLQVTDQQISDLIESAVNSLKDENSRGTVVKSTAVAPAKPAEMTTTPAETTTTEPNAEVPSANEILK
ncbi:holin [Streptococcus mutans]|uniref:phage holin, LLH family n=1 Tax=Streptococcus mutans TaxID=1309 RepID=UPI00145533B4|nr:phage holin, LLH family [Streptococcus mutans]NLQ88511.1 holin [Streptococcus mutans]